MYRFWVNYLRSFLFLSKTALLRYYEHTVNWKFLNCTIFYILTYTPIKLQLQSRQWTHSLPQSFHTHDCNQPILILPSCHLHPSNYYLTLCHYRLYFLQFYINKMCNFWYALFLFSIISLYRHITICLSIHFSVDGHLSFFQFLPVMNNAAINIHVCT